MDLGLEQAKRIKLVLPQPVAPANFGDSKDTRKVGIGVIRLRFLN